VAGFPASADALEDLVDEDRRAPRQVKRVGAIGHETPGLGVLPLRIHCWEAPLRRELCDLAPPIRQYAVRENHMKAAQARLAGKRVDGETLSDRVRARPA
jgi:hypothetical protein